MKALIIIIIAVVLIGSGLAMWACWAAVDACAREEKKEYGTAED